MPREAFVLKRYTNLNECHNTLWCAGLVVLEDPEMSGQTAIVIVLAGLCYTLPGHQGRCLHAQWRPVKSSHLYLYSAFNNTNCVKATAHYQNRKIVYH